MLDGLVQLTIRIASEAASTLEIAHDRITWRGPSDADPEAPILVWELAAPDAAILRAFTELDPDALGAAVTALAMPAGMLADLAARCLAHASIDPVHRALREEQTLVVARNDVNTDVRWARALARAWIDRGLPAGEIAEVPVEVLVPQGDDRIRHASTLADGRVVALVLGPHAALHVFEAAAARRLPLPYNGVAWIELLRALDGEQEDPSTFVLAAFHPTEAWVAIAIVDLDGRVHAHGGGALEEWPRKASRSTDAIWIHTDHHHCRFALHADEIDLATALARPTAQPLARLECGPFATAVAGRWLLRWISIRSVPGAVADAVAWVSLDDGGSTAAYPWGHQLIHLVREPGEATLWATTHDGLYRLDGGAPPVRVWQGAVNGGAISRAANAAWLGLAKEPVVVEIDLASGAERWRTTLPQPAYRLRIAAGGILASLSAFSWLDRRGAILMTSEERRETAFAQLADGTSAASAGEQVAIVSADGVLRRLPPFFDGNLLGATRDRFVFGPAGGGYPATRGDTIVAFDRTGRRTARVAWPDGSVVTHFVAFGPGPGGDGGATHAYLVDARGLVRFDPRGVTDGQPSVPAPPPHRTLRDQTHHGYDTHNPRDDFPEIGIELLHASCFGIRCDYGGSEGVYTEVPIRVGDGAVVTLVDCTLVRGGGGSIVQRASTLVLVRCTLPSNTVWQLGHDCHLVLIDCTVADLRVEPGPGASVIVHGASMVREHAQWRIG